MLLPESFTGAEGTAADTTPYQSGGKWMISVDFLGSGLSELIAVKNGPREWMYLATCKAALSYIHLGQSPLAH